MKRTAIRRDPDAIRAWRQKPRKPLNKVGRRARRARRSVDAFRNALRERSRGVCEAYLVTDNWRAICGVDHVHFGHDPQHLWPEDRDRGIHDPTRGLWLCRTSHDWSHAHPDLAKAAGLLRPSIAGGSDVS